MQLNQQKYDKTLWEEKIARARINQSFVDKLTVHCRNRKEQIARLSRFWFNVIKADLNLVSQLNKTDSEILENHLTSIEVVYDADSKLKFSIIFDFIKNEYFSNDHIFKRFNFRDEVLISTESTCINWKKEILNIVSEESDEEDYNTFEVQLTFYSFFHWFNSTYDKEKL